MRPRPFLLLLVGVALALMAGDADAEEPLWDFPLGKDENGNYIGASSISISADGEYIAIAVQHQIYLFHKSNNTPLWNYNTGDDVRSVAISADGEYIATGGLDSKVYLFSKNSNTPLWNYTFEESAPYAAMVAAIDISENGDRIAVGYSDRDESNNLGNIYLFSKSSNTPLWNYSTGDIVHSISISADGGYIAASSSSYHGGDQGSEYHNNKIYLFHESSGTPLWNYTTEGRGLTGHNSVKISANGEYIVVGTSFAYYWPDQRNRLYLFSTSSGEPLWIYTAELEDDYDSRIMNWWSVDISADGEYIVAGGSKEDDGWIFFFGKDSNETLWFHETRGETRSVDISADGEYLATVESYAYSSDYGLRIYSKDGYRLWGSPTAGERCCYHSWPIMAMSDDGHYIVGQGEGDGNIISLFKFTLPDLFISSMDFSSDNPKEGEEIIINASIRLLKKEITKDFEVRFFLDSEDGESIGHEVVFASELDVGVEYIVSIPWVAISGTHTIYAMADATNVIFEGVNEENYFEKQITVADAKDNTSEESNEMTWYQLEVVVVVILAGLFYLRRDTDPSETTNKILRLLLYGIAILLLVASAIILFIGSVTMTMTDEQLIDPEDNPWKIWILNAALFALTGAFLGQKLYESGSSYQSSTSSIPSSKPIFGDRPKTPMFTPEDELTAIECPGCNAQMKVPKLGKMQTVTCDSCGLSGEIEV